MFSPSALLKCSTGPFFGVRLSEILPKFTDKILELLTLIFHTEVDKHYYLIIADNLISPSVIKVSRIGRAHV